MHSEMASILQQLLEIDAQYQDYLKRLQAQAGQLFKQARVELDMTQREMAEKLECDFTYISKIEHGHMRPGNAVLEKLATVLKATDRQDGEGMTNDE
jgi:transcriptional regulator with XRE-family HTH domain